MAERAPRVPVPGPGPSAGTGPGRARRASLRSRITAAAVLAVALTLGVFTLVFALVQQAVLADGPRRSASADVDRAVSALAIGSTPDVAVAGEAEGALVVVTDSSGRVLAAGGEDDLVESASSLAAAGSGDRVTLDGDRFVVERDDVGVETTPTPSAEPTPTASSRSGDDDDDDAAEDADDVADDSTPTPEATPEPAETVTTEYGVVAARSLDEASAASSASLVTLGVAIPVALLVLGVTTWLVVGRALRPVESMRREVDAVTAQSLSHRLPDPGGSDEIARLARTLNGMLDRLDSSATAQRRFVGDASHELKTPLATIRQHAEVALLHPGSIDGAALADTVLGEEARLTALVQGLLVLARADEGALGVTRRPVDLDDLVVAETARLRGVARPDGRGSLAVDATAVGPARVDGDEGLLGQVVHNLVANAARHADTRVAVALDERDGRAVLTVDDDGAGVAEADRERVFERFVRLDEARARDSGGSGLGLAIVREIVRVHGGSVSITTSPLGGARFVVDLPAGPV
ncbi:HAMP domain-containing sensor histidine kinase [Frigoribacterium sp. Leaf44]|uniref:HAMP domain-containing sensor histidine kinase n=1 Tax=Frigoribacterium sp. Leaf44 TaxID=1736220 RepID=UPI000AECB602|nr:HAMP domain-containing sensor histidine kinase [Frigoribacterium sp. Leaf44]